MRDGHIMSENYPIYLRLRKDFRIENNYLIYPRVRAMERTKFHTKEKLGADGRI